MKDIKLSKLTLIGVSAFWIIAYQITGQPEFFISSNVFLAGSFVLGGMEK